MVELEILFNIGKQLAKARGISNSRIAVFGSFPIVISMGDLYQFPPIAKCPLWGEPQTEEDYNGKTLWLSFSSVITLIQQMCQQSNLVFAQLLRRVRKRALTQADVSILNKKVVIGLILSDPLNKIVIIQQNKTRYLINRLQIERFSCFVGHDIVIFPAQHSCIKKEGGKVILQKDLFSI